MANYTFGIDLGQVQDHSALAIVERLVAAREIPFYGIKTTEHFHVRHIHRWKLNTPYRTVIRDIGVLMRANTGALMDGQLVIDGTGVGKAVVRLFDQAFREGQLGNYWPASYVITGGREITKTVVPKRELVSTVQTLLQAGRLKVADSLEFAPVLRQEFLEFRAKTLPSGAQSYESARERAHDDIVLAIALACWFRHNNSEPRYIDGAVIEEKSSIA